ncbi:hypothetical protein J3169_004396 [Salmonella enterica]|nr:hypothetical protein [Salmonella enterica]
MPTYFTEEARAVSYDDVRRALIEIKQKYRAATDNGLLPSGFPRRNPDAAPVDILAAERDGEPGAYAVEAVRHCVDWLVYNELVATQRKTPNTAHTAYGYKHSVEYWIQAAKTPAENHPYIPMMAFIAAAWLLGIPETADHNPCYPLSERTLNAMHNAPRYG